MRKDAAGTMVRTLDALLRREGATLAGGRLRPWWSLASLAVLLPLLVCPAALRAQGIGQADEAQEQASPETELSLFNLDLLDSRDGYAIPADSRFLPGETIHVYFQIKGYRIGEEERVLLRYKLEALDPDGRRFYRTEGGDVDVELAPQDENWMPVVRYSPRIPHHAGGGTYMIRIEVRDQLGGSAVRTSLPVAVDGTRVKSADELLIRSFKFSKTDGGDALAEPVFGPGDEIWATFFITGYETRDDNTFDVESDAWVVDAGGKKIFVFESRGEAGSPYYPRLWLPARFRLSLDTTIPTGHYTVVLRLRDRVGGVDSTERYRFQVR